MCKRKKDVEEKYKTWKQSGGKFKSILLFRLFKVDIFWYREVKILEEM